MTRWSFNRESDSVTVGASARRACGYLAIASFNRESDSVTVGARGAVAV